MPFVTTLLTTLAQTTLILVVDGSVVGKGCVTLMASVVYKGRALPIAWIVIKGKKGHMKEEIHVQLVEQLHQIIPAGAQVVFLGDGEFDGIKLLDTVNGYGWQYVCRTGKSLDAYSGEIDHSFRNLPTSDSGDYRHLLNYELPIPVISYHAFEARL